MGPDIIGVFPFHFPVTLSKCLVQGWGVISYIDSIHWPRDHLHSCKSLEHGSHYSKRWIIFSQMFVLQITLNNTAIAFRTKGGYAYWPLQNIPVPNIRILLISLTHGMCKFLLALLCHHTETGNWRRNAKNKN